jgi:cytochrome c oxidase assembly factor CtaG
MKPGISSRATMLMSFLLGACLFPRVAAAHTGEALAPHDLWHAWVWSPFITLPLALGAVWYAVGTKALWRASARGRGVRGSEVACFAAGWTVLALALVSPLHPLGEVLFSAHMVQHELMMVVAAPLLVLGRPLVPFVWAMPPSWRRFTGDIARVPLPRRLWAALTRPSTAWVLHATAIWVWHVPSLYDATLDNAFVHTLQHVSFLSTALLFWWSVLRGARLARGAAIGSVFTTMLHTSALGVILAFTNSLWYPAYATTTFAWGLTPVEDQQLGGLVMWIPAGVSYLVATLVLVAGWMKDSESRTRMREELVAQTASVQWSAT